jgi:hypothetical protein
LNWKYRGLAEFHAEDWRKFMPRIGGNLLPGLIPTPSAQKQVHMAAALPWISPFPRFTLELLG